MNTTYENPNSDKTTTELPESATQPIKSPKKRGRKGTNVVDAFSAVPASPVPVSDFSEEHNVSTHVLRQAKRFDKTGLNGKVKVKKDKESGTLMIWREAE